MGLYSSGLIIGRIFVSKIWGAYFQEGLFLEELIIGILQISCIIIMTLQESNLKSSYMTPTCESGDEVLKCDHSNYVVQGGSNIWVYG